tara:strand:+ start:66 stop:266 length:201 start_codon:yes stop_codon:yes gene_type:complete
MRKFSGFKEIETDNDQEMSVQEFLNAIEEGKIRNMENVISNPENFNKNRVRRNIQKFRKFKSQGRL